MSVLRAAQPIRPIAPRRHLRPVGSAPAPIRRPQQAQSVRSVVATNASRALFRKIVIGLISVVLLNLFINLLCNQSIYKISELKRESADLATKAQIVGQQVDSLRSPQNLANSARALGMIVSSNQVFLNVRDGKVLGNAVPASVGNANSVSSNMIANAALISKSNPSRFAKSQTAKLDLPVVISGSSSVISEKKGNAEVVLPNDGIPASPTH
ncbi:MAG: hypothetical protein EBS85_00890 [Micrococcales bacterium]|nr:hypothetical protein [Actinomycetota bacterium]NCA07274.1 hypothetical protein [Micrococcales bacterium]